MSPLCADCGLKNISNDQCKRMNTAYSDVYCYLQIFMSKCDKELSCITQAHF